MNYDSDPLYVSTKAIQNLNLIFREGYWWYNDRKCIPKEQQQDLISQYYKKYKKETKVLLEIRKEFWWPRMLTDVNAYAIRHDVQVLSNTLNKFAKDPKLIEKIARKNISRLHKLITLQNSYYKEAMLMQKLGGLYSDMHLLAFEYNIDDGGLNKQQHGDVILYTPDKFYIIECKSINNIEERRQKVMQQAITCTKRVKSWIHHIASYDPNFQFMNKCEFIPAIFTEEHPNMQLL